MARGTRRKNKVPGSSSLSSSSLPKRPVLKLKLSWHLKQQWRGRKVRTPVPYINDKKSVNHSFFHIPYNMHIWKEHFFKRPLNWYLALPLSIILHYRLGLLTLGQMNTSLLFYFFYLFHLLNYIFVRWVLNCNCKANTHSASFIITNYIVHGQMDILHFRLKFSKRMNFFVKIFGCVHAPT